MSTGQETQGGPMKEEIFGAGATAKTAAKPRLWLEEDSALRFALALGHPIRLKMLAAYWNDGRHSAQTMMREGIATAGLVSYHNGQLESWGAIELVERVPRGGVHEKFFDLTGFGRACIKVASTINAYRD